MTLPWLPQSQLSTGAVGRMVAGNVLALIALSALSADIAVAQVTTINVTAAQNSTAYSVRVVASADDSWGFDVDRTVSVTTDASGTQAELAVLIADAINADAILGAVVSATAGSVTVPLTGRNGGAGYTFTVTFPVNPSTDLTQTATTAAADAPTYTIGRFCERATGQTGSNPKVQEINALTNEKLTYTVTHGAGATYSGTFTVQDPTGIEAAFSWTASAGANLAATLAAIDVALTAAVAGITGATVVDTASPTVVVNFPAGYNGAVSLTSTGTGGGGSPAMTAAVTTGSVVPAYYLVRDPQDQAPIRGQSTTTIATVSNGQPRPVPIVLGGGCSFTVEVASGTSFTSGAQVYVETAAGANLGRATATPSATAAPVYTRPGAPVRFAYADPTSSARAVVTIP
jgi:hypothetical protein